MVKRKTGAERTRAVAYTRVSTDRQAERGTSLETQRKQIEAFADLYALEIVAWEEDRGESAKSMRRPALARARSLLRRKEADALIVAKLDRLTRSVRDLADMLGSDFAPGRGALLSVGEQVDTRTATGRMVLNVITTIAQWERERIGERVSDMHRRKRERGKHGERVGKPPFGLRVGSDGRTLEPDPEEESTLDRIRTLRAAGASHAKIAATLTAEGRRPRGTGWHGTTIQRVLARLTRDEAPSEGETT